MLSISGLYFGFICEAEVLLEFLNYLTYCHLKSHFVQLDRTTSSFDEDLKRCLNCYYAVVGSYPPLLLVKTSCLFFGPFRYVLFLLAYRLRARSLIRL